MFKENHRFLLDMHHYVAKEHSVKHKDIYYSTDYTLLQLKLVWKKKKRQHYLINDGLQITSRERIAAFLVFVSPHVAMWALLTEILLPSPSLTHRHTHHSPDCPDHSWMVFHSNKHPGKQKHAACRKKKPFTLGCPRVSVCRTNTHCVFCRGLSPSFPPSPQPCLTLQPFGCSSWVSLLPATRCDYI